jgi:hypothetical protein
MGGAIGFTLIDSNGAGAGTNTEGAIYFKAKDSGGGLTEKMRIDSVGNVGIGTTDPGETLTVARESDPSLLISNIGSTTGTSSILFGDSSSNEPGRIIYEHVNNSLDFYTDQEQRVTIDNVGNVGIGTTNPSEKLEIYEDAPEVWLTSSNANGHTYALKSTSNGYFWIGKPTGENTLNTSEAVISIDSSGNVGIGTASPLNILNVVGSGSNKSIAYFNNTDPLDGNGILVRGGGSNAQKYVAAFESADSTRIMQINSNGNVGIGTTSPTHQLQLSTDSAAKPSTNTWTISSDSRAKENIELANLDVCYDNIKKIPLKRYTWSSEFYNEEQVKDRSKIGWIAQDVESVFPKAVDTHEVKYAQKYEEQVIPAVEEVLDEVGNVIQEAQEERVEKVLIDEKTIEDFKSLNADQLYASMYGAIQKLMQKVETLEQEVSDLKGS